jgi:diguanylate cyclase (GGDEF)-like protein
MTSDTARVTSRADAARPRALPGLKWSVRGLIAFGFGLLVLILACIAVGAAWQTRTNQTALAELDHHSTTASLLQNVEADAGISGLLLQRYVDAGNDSYVKEINDNATAAQQSLEQALALGGPPELSQLTGTGAQLVEDASRAAALKQAGDSADASALLEQIGPVFHDYRLQLQSLAALELAQVAQLRDRADAAGQRAFWLVVGASTIGIIVGIIASVWIARLIMKPLASLEETAHRVSAGDLSARAPSTGPKELAHLGSVLNEMMQAIETRTADLGRANSQLSEKNRDLSDARQQAATDPLTGLGNHRSFHKRVREEVALAQETGSGVGLIMIDVDGFKDVNDSLGHLAGDQLLRDLAETLSDIATPKNTYRYGGDELAVLVPRADISHSLEIAELLRKAACAMVGFPMSISLGVAGFPEAAASAEELVYRADMAMYWAKSSGKNCVEKWASETHRSDSGPRYANGRSPRRDFVASLCEALNSNDDETRRRAERCARYALELALDLDLSVAEVASLRQVFAASGERDSDSR